MNPVASNLPAWITAGVRMKYPSCYVLLVDDRPDAHRPVMPSPGLMGSGQVDDGLLEPGSRVKGMEPLSEVAEKTNRLFSSRMVEKITQDSVITAGLSKRWEVLCHTNYWWKTSIKPRLLFLHPTWTLSPFSSQLK